MRAFPHEQLRDLSAAILAGFGTPADLARVVGDSLVDANLAGHDSHGVLRLPSYCGSLQAGDILPAARAIVASHNRATARIDGGWGWGQPAMLLATDTAIELAREFAIGAAVVDRCYHIGRAAPYVERIARAGMIGIAMANAGPAVAPFGGRDRVLGTNPFAWAMPHGEGAEPLSFDAATAGIAAGKLMVARSKGEQVGPGLLVDADGEPTQDPDDFINGGAILPFGGHKGSGISILVQMLGRTLTGVFATDFNGPRGANGPIVIALDPTAFGSLDAFAREVDAQGNAIRQSHPSEGFSEVLLPGDIELKTKRERLTGGIPIPDSTWSEIVALAESLTIDRRLLHTDFRQ